MTDMMQAIETIRSIYQMLEDEESKEIYMKRWAYYASHDDKYLFDIVDTYMRKCSTKLCGGFEAEAFRLFDSLPTDRDFILFGAGQDGARLLPYAMRYKNFAGFCSSTVSKQEKGYLSFPVMSPEELISRKDLTVVISTVYFRDDIMQILQDGGYPQELIIDGPEFYGPAYGEAEQYFGPCFMHFRDEEVFVDAGCYDFDSSLALAKHCKCKKVYAFEPDPENYQRCLRGAARRNKERIFDVKLFPCGTWSQNTTLYFDSTSNRRGASHICEPDKEHSSVPVMTIDEAIEQADHVTLIKMDIEGSELESLKGARETILRDKPKLAISIYHKLEDLWELPLYIKSLVPEYRFYIRHHNTDFNETILYAVMPE